MIEGKTAIRMLEEQSKSRQVLGHLVQWDSCEFNEPTLDVFNPAYGTVIKHLESAENLQLKQLSPGRKKRCLTGEELRLLNEQE